MDPRKKCITIYNENMQGMGGLFGALYAKRQGKTEIYEVPNREERENDPFYLTQGDPSSPIIFIIDPTLDMAAQLDKFSKLAKLCKEHSVQREWIFVARDQPVNDDQKLKEFIANARQQLPPNRSKERCARDCAPVYFSSDPTQVLNMGILHIEERMHDLERRAEFARLAQRIENEVIKVLKGEMDRLSAAITISESKRQDTRNKKHRHQKITETIDLLRRKLGEASGLIVTQGKNLDLSGQLMPQLKSIIDQSKVSFEKRKDKPGIKVMLGAANLLMALTVVSPLLKKLGHMGSRYYDEVKAQRSVQAKEKESKATSPGVAARKKINHRDTFFLSLKGKSFAAAEDALDNLSKISKTMKKK